jgi:hypothetical protein
MKAMLSMTKSALQEARRTAPLTIQQVKFSLVAKWFIFKPKTPIWLHFRGSHN